jgi:hypothetical protein
MRAFLLPCLLIFATACSTERIVEKPVPYEVVRYETVPVPAELTSECEKRPIPEDLTYGEALALWAEDRASMDVCNGRLRAIRGLE